MKELYELSDSRGKLNVSRTSFSSITFFTPDSSARFTSSYTVTLDQGVYLIEAWGSGGSVGSGGMHPGKGAYTKGKIFIRNALTLYLFVGNKAGFNSADVVSPHLAYGGGASDVRLKNGEWNDFESLKSRILVSGGGGGTEWDTSFGGHGGQNGTAGNYKTYFANGATQTSGGDGSKNINFGSGVYRNTIKGGFGDIGEQITSSDFGGMGGGGYYEGASMDYAGAGGGGSSYISGHQYCDAIYQFSTKDNITHTKQSVHYSQLSFYKTEIISGNSAMPYFASDKKFQGNDDLGAIRITKLRSFCVTQKCHSFNHARMLLVFMSLLISY